MRTRRGRPRERKDRNEIAQPNLGADLHQLLAPRRQRPVRDCRRQDQCAQDVGEVVCRPVRLEANVVGPKAMAR